MMRYAELQRRIDSTVELGEIMGAMRSMAAVRLEEAQRALGSIRRYTDVVEHAIGLARATVADDGAEPDERSIVRWRALVVFTAEHGFVGPFNRTLAERLHSEQGRADAIFVVGRRGARFARSLGCRVDEEFPMATRTGGIVETARRVTIAVQERLPTDAVLGLDVLATWFGGRGKQEVELRPILPVPRDRGPASAVVPIVQLPGVDLLRALFGELIVAELTRAGTESMACENDARFRTMQAASENLDEKVEELKQQARQTRQEEITTELLDIVAGAEAVASRRRRSVPEELLDGGES